MGHIDHVSSILIGEVHSHHGVVISFSGDGIACWFEEPDADTGAFLPVSAERAVRCGLRMQEAINRLQAFATPSGKRFPIGVKVAVTTGPARRFLVGDPETYVIEVLAGNTIDRLANAGILAGRGEVIACSTTVERLESRLAVAAWRLYGGERFGHITGLTTGRDMPPPPIALEVDDEVARAWLLPPVYDHLQKGTEAFLAELRPSVAVFLQFAGIDYDEDDDAGRKLDEFTRNAQDIIDRYEGFLLQISMGDKGSYLYATFGAPVAHENDSARAAATALELRELASRLDYLAPVRIGISRGIVHSGAYGSELRRTYSAMGSEVNVSARLMSACSPGQILISSRVAAEIKRDIRVRPVPPIAMKGISDTFDIFELQGRTDRQVVLPTSATVLVGREEEQVELAQALAGLADGRSSAVVIEGAAGIGKSVLLQKFVSQATSKLPEARILIGLGDAIELSTPYFAWRPVFETLFSAYGNSWRKSLTTHLSPEHREMSPLLNNVLSLNLPENSLTEQLAGEARQDNTHEMVVALIREALAGAPLVLIFDDAQWLDSATWKLLVRVREEIAPILMIVVARPMDAETPVAYSELRRDPATRVVNLDVLSPGSVERLVSWRLGAARLASPVARYIQEVAEGHPFFSEELALALRESGLIRIVEQEVQFAPRAERETMDFPGTIQGIINSRIDQLPAQHQLTVKVASVVGRTFGYEVVSAIYPATSSEVRLREILDDLDRRSITLKESSDSTLTYIFKHIITHDVVYDLMTSTQKQSLHRSAALWYEQRVNGDLARYFALLGHHWQHANEPDKSSAYYDKAGENAFRDYANLEAVRLLTLADELSAATAPPLSRALRQRTLGEANYRLTYMEASRNNYRQALEVFGRPVPKSAPGRVVALLRQLLRQGVHRLFPGRFVGRAAAGDKGALLETSRTLEAVSEVYYNLGDFLAAFYCVLAAFNLAERAGPSPELLRGYANMCATFGQVGLNSIADSYRARAVNLLPSISDQPAVAWSMIPLSIQSLWVGEWGRAEEEVGRSLEIYARLGDWRRWCVAAWIWPQVAQGRGELGRAAELWEELHSVALRSRDTRHQVRARGGQFFSYLSLGQVDLAHECLLDVEKALGENPEMVPLEERLQLALKATWAMLQDDRPAARAAVQDALEAIGRAKFKFDLLEVFAAPAEVMLGLWQRGEAAADEASQCVKVLGSYARAYRLGRPRALRSAGTLAWLSGNKDKARENWARSMETAQAMSMPYERALTMREMGHRLGDSELLASSGSILTELGCVLPDDVY